MTDFISVNERSARRGFYVPSGSSLTDKQIDRVLDVLLKVIL